MRVKARRGYHRIAIVINERRILESRYEPFPFADQYTSVPALVYPLWEEYEKVPLDLTGRVASELKFLKTEVREAGTNPTKFSKTK